MNDIFISYDRTDRVRAQGFADAFESHGWSVWWDREIPLGQSFDQVIEEQLNAARCVVVLWSKESVRSRWVKTEASAAIDRGCLVPVFIDKVPSPLEFRLIQAAELWDWNGNPADPEFRRLLDAVRRMLGEAPSGSTVEKTLPVWTKPSRRPTPAVLRGIVAAVLIAAVLFLSRGAFQGFLRTATEPAVEPNTSVIPPPSSPVSAPPSTAADRPGVPPENAISIEVGDRIADGIPVAGAGSIEQPYEQDRYVFRARRGQRVYFRMLGHSNGMSYINWRLADEDGMEVFGKCLGCTEPGVQMLTRGGTYTLTVGAEKDSSTGTYQFQLFDVPPPSRFPIRIGDAIGENIPGTGAGVIESSGAEDVYTFTAAPRQTVYFRMLSHSNGLAYINWRLTDANDMEVFNACLGCSEPGVRTLIRGGEYTLTIGNSVNPSTGLYRLQLSNVPPPDRFTIRTGDKVGPGVPGAGAGVIEGPGAEDVYIFSATPGQRALFRLLNRDRGMDYINWRLEDDNGMEIFNRCLGCSEPGVQNLTRGGRYTLTVGNRGNPSTGNYTFEFTLR